MGYGVELGGLQLFLAGVSSLWATGVEFRGLGLFLRGGVFSWCLERLYVGLEARCCDGPTLPSVSYR